MTATKDIKIGNNEYQLGGLSARNGSWVAGQFAMIVLGKLENPEHETTEKDLGAALALSFRQLPEEIFNKVQGKCLEVCGRYAKIGEATTPLPVLRKDGTWNDVAEPSLPELFALTVAALAFNLHPFFAAGALETLLTALPNVSQASDSSAPR